MHRDWRLFPAGDRRAWIDAGGIRKRRRKHRAREPDFREDDEGKPIRVPADQSGNPTWAGDVACWSLALLEVAASGIWHLAGDRPEMNRVEWARDILAGLSARGMSLSPDLKPVSTASLGQPAARPLKAGMSCRKIQGFMSRICRAPSDLPEIAMSASGLPEFKL